MSGHVEIWQEVVSLDCGQGLELPLRFQFSSAGEVRGILGEGFWCPLLESRTIVISEKLTKVCLPCGKAVFMRRSPNDPAKFKSYDGQWLGKLAGDDFTFSRDDGWMLSYHQSRLTSLHTDQGRQLTWIYRGNVVTEIREGQATLLRVTLNEENRATAFTLNSQKFEVTWDRRPLVKVVQVQTILQGFAPTLSTLTWPSGKKVSFEFGLNEQRAPTLLFKNEENDKQLYTWDAETGLIRGEGQWTYEIGKGGGPLAPPDIYRYNSTGQREGVAIDTAQGTVTRLYDSGEKEISTLHRAPGPLYNQVQKIEEESGGKRTIILRVAYDELGRVLRKTDETGFSTVYDYVDGKRIIKGRLAPSDPVILQKLAEKEKELLKRLAVAQNEYEKRNVFLELGIFYIHECGDAGKALSLLPQLDRSTSFFIHLHAVQFSLSLTEAQRFEDYTQLLREFPEKKEILALYLKK